MSALGVHFALSAEQEMQLLTAQNDEQVIEVVKAIDELGDVQHLVETGKAWDAIQRCFCKGEFTCEGGEYPLNLAICGGRQLLSDPDPAYIVAYLTAAQVREVAQAIVLVSKEDLLARYYKIDPNDYVDLGEQDFEYTWAYFEDLSHFFGQATQERRAVVFLVDL